MSLGDCHTPCMLDNDACEYAMYLNLFQDKDLLNQPILLILIRLGN